MAHDGVVVGGGPAGLATALSLRRKGQLHRVSVLEKGPPPEARDGGWTGAGLNLTSGIAALYSLGFDMPALGLGQPLSAVSAFPAGKNLSLYSADLSAAGARSVLRGSLLDALRSECASEGIDVLYNCKVDAIESNASESAVSLSCNKASQKNQREHLSTQLAVVAGGGKSASLLDKPTPNPAGCRILIALGESASGRLDGSDDDPASAQQVFGDGVYALRVTAAGFAEREGVRDVLYLSLGGNRARDGSNESWSREHGSEQEALRRHMLDLLSEQDFPDSHLQIVRHAVALAEVGACITPAQQPNSGSWRSGKRCTLLGDAAHSMPPYLGQGANQALQDALALGKCVSEANMNDADSVAGVLDKYERVRAAPSRIALEASRVVGAVETCRWPLTVSRNLSMRIAGLLHLPQRILQSGAQVRV